MTDLVASLNALVPTNDEPPCPAPSQADALTFGGGGAPSSMVHIERDGGCDFVWSDTGVHAYSTSTLKQQLAAITANAAGSASSAASFAATLTSPSAGASAIGDATAISQCEAAEKRGRPHSSPRGTRARVDGRRRFHHHRRRRPPLRRLTRAAPR